MSAEAFPLALPELRPFHGFFPGFDTSVPPSQGIRALMSSMPPPPMPDPSLNLELTNLEINGPSGAPLRLFVVKKAGEKALPVVLYFHGGGGIAGMPEMDLPQLAYFASNGLAVVSVDYRLAPEHPYPAAFDDAEAAWKWLKSDEGASKLGADTTRAAVYGSSAGSWIAFGLAMRLKEQGLTLPKIVVLDSVLADDRADAKLYPTQAEGHPYAKYFLWTTQNARDAKGLIFGTLDPVPIEAAPLRSTSPDDFKGLCPFYLCSSELDSLADHGPALFARLKEAGVSVELHVWRRTMHAFSSMMAGTPIAQAAYAEYVRALKSELE